MPVGVEAVQFTIIYAHPDVRSSSWPGANAMRTTLVGRFTLPVSGKTVYVVAHALEQLPSLEPKSRTGRLLPGFTRDDLLRSAEEGTLRGIAFGVDEDGMRWFMDAPSFAVGRRLSLAVATLPPCDPTSVRSSSGPSSA